MTLADFGQLTGWLHSPRKTPLKESINSNIFRARDHILHHIL
jgi:hypothetical protein